MTLIVNATTTKYVLEGLGMTKPSPSKAKIMHNASEELLDVMENKLQEIKINPYLCNANMSLVRKYCVDEVERLVLDLFKKGVAIEEEQPQKKSGQVAPQNLALWKEVRRRVLVALKANFCKQFSEGVVGSQAFLVLERECSEAFDEDDAVIMRWSSLSPYLKINHMIQRAQDWPPPIGPIATKWVFATLTLGSDIASSFGVAHEQVLKQIEETNLIQDHKTQADIVNLLKSELHEAKSVLHQMDSIFPEIAVSISTRHSIRRLLNTGEHCIKALNKKGMIDELETQTFIKRIEAQLKHLVFFPPSIPLPSKDQLFHEIEWMNTLDDETFNMLCSAAKPQLFNPNELILKQGEVSNFVFIVARGSVNVLVNVNGEEREIQHKGVGLTLGEISLLKGIPRSSTVRALTGVLTFKLPFAAMFRAMHAYPPLRSSLWKFACFHIAENTLLSQCEFQSLTWLQLRKIVHQWKVVHVHDIEQEVVAEPKKEEENNDVTVSPIHMKHELSISEQIYPADTAMMLIHGICDEFDEFTVMPTREQENEHVYQPPKFGDDLACYEEDKKQANDDVVDVQESSESSSKGSGLLRRFTKMPGPSFRKSGHSSHSASENEGSSGVTANKQDRKKSIIRFESTMHSDLRPDAEMGGKSVNGLASVGELTPVNSIIDKTNNKPTEKPADKPRRRSLTAGLGRKSSLSKLVIGSVNNEEQNGESNSPRQGKDLKHIINQRVVKPRRQHSSEMSQTLEKMYGKKRKSIFSNAARIPIGRRGSATERRGSASSIGRRGSKEGLDAAATNGTLAQALPLSSPGLSKNIGSPVLSKRGSSPSVGLNAINNYL
jgi:CRP-like cAMP-binding protein